MNGTTDNGGKDLEGSEVTQGSLCLQGGRDMARVLSGMMPWQLGWVKGASALTYGPGWHRCRTAACQAPLVRHNSLIGKLPTRPAHASEWNGRPRRAAVRTAKNPLSREGTHQVSN
ncbi:hypothetical protein AAFF_G00064800 [Aldrovandia affinis]|uniref:Uncharacterized protein n=1 Tax=Aldrovandia affinis TaxID=143900 RepID=A0AAD7T3S8_9TELE|nr:hypothetical protein AAFF_G00064800 [Aldrovandia affinis]